MGITEKIKRNIDMTSWKDKIPVNYIYTVGIAGEKFFREIKDNAKIVGTKCEKCEVTYVPPKIYCERCFARLENYIDVGTNGTVHTFTICYENVDDTKKEKPSIMAMIKIDGTDGGFIHWLGEVDPGEVKIGMPVEVIFKAKKEREGSILDIKYFKPIKK